MTTQPLLFDDTETFPLFAGVPQNWRPAKFDPPEAWRQLQAIDPEILRWQEIIDRNLHGPNEATGLDRLRTYVCSLMLGRDFGEDVEDYFDRTHRRQFYDWAMTQVQAP